MAGLDIKICGLTTREAVDAVIAGGATHAGFIHFAKSPRHIAPEPAAPLVAAAQAGGLKAVSVTVDADDDVLAAIVERMAPDMLQLHGRETPARVAAVKARFGLPVMKALSISVFDDLAKADPYRGIADRFLFDAKPPEGAVLPGGNAVTFDWSLMTRFSLPTDYLLAGGLDAGNVADALLIAAPPGIDLSSGVETAPGVKDARLIAQFLSLVRAAFPRPFDQRTG